ncbi:MAG: CBS domain-containing protein [Veillonellaceae bacterium]|nr:CBS domain-containing protein [Veillonellaceae bacterium]
MFVAKRMTPNPITIESTTTIADASELMRKHKFRRLPVVDKGRLVGIVTDRDLRTVAPSPATSLSIFELNYLLAKMQVKDIMHKDVITIPVDATIEEAALIMSTRHIGGLVVVGEKDSVVGVITETDIFNSFVEIMGLKEGKTRFTFKVSNQVGVLHDITRVFKDLGINISSLATYPVEGGAEMVVRFNAQDTDELVKRLTEIGYPPQHAAQIG